MGKPRHDWYPVSKKMIMLSPHHSKDESLTWFIWIKAIEEACDETKGLPDGELRLKAIDDILIKKVKTYDGVALEIHYDWRTIQNWITSFVNLVGRKAGC